MTSGQDFGVDRTNSKVKRKIGNHPRSFRLGTVPDLRNKYGPLREPRCVEGGGWTNGHNGNGTGKTPNVGGDQTWNTHYSERVERRLKIGREILKY